MTTILAGNDTVSTTHTEDIVDVVLFNFLHKTWRKPLAGITILGFFLAPFQTTLAATSLFPKEINYQAKLTDATGVAVADGAYNVTFRLYTTPVSATTTNIWEETHTGANRISLTGGLLSTLLGQVTSLASIDFNQTLYLGVEVGGTTLTPTWDGEMSPRKQLGTVPSSMVADTLDGLDSSAFVQTNGTSTIASSSAQTLLTLNQSGAGNILDLIGSAGANFFSVLSSGNVGIGTTNPTTKLTVNGSVTIADGTQGAGKVLTSDANGKASWGTGGGGGTGLEALNKHYFITATTYNGNLGGVAGANTKCNADANAIAGKSYVAILYGQLPDYLNHNGQSFHRDFRLKFYNLSYGESRSVFAVGLNSIGPETDSSKYKNSGSFWRGDSLLAYHCLNWTSSALLKRAYLGNIGWSTGRGEVMMDVGMIDNVSDSGSCSSLKSLLCVER